MAFSPSRGLLYSEPPEPDRSDDRPAASDDERTSASTDAAPTPADD